RRRVKRQQPDRIDPEAGDVVELLQQPGKIAGAVVVRIVERFDMQLVDDRVLVPERVKHHRQIALFPGHAAAATGRMRHIANGRIARSRRTCCTLPCQTTLRPVINTSTEAAAWSGRSQNHSGTSMAQSCGKCGSRLTATRITFSRSAVALE